MVPRTDDQITVTRKPSQFLSSSLVDLFRVDEGLDELVDDLRAVALPPFLPLSAISLLFGSFFARCIFLHPFGLCISVSIGKKYARNNTGTGD